MTVEGGFRVGVYVDAYNLYYGARGLCGRGTPGWRWLDVRALSERLLQARSTVWPGAIVTKLVYCTARVNGSHNATAARDQDVYLRALRESGSADHIELGTYVSKLVTGPLALRRPRRKVEIVSPAWPIKVKSPAGDEPDAVFMAQVASWEEKGSDVNVATHLLVDVLGGKLDAALVVSNDSDLKLPVWQARRHVPVATINPSTSATAGDLRGTADDGVGRHWWYSLSADDIRASQLPDDVGRLTKPVGW